jgi:hypothetical protein
LPELIARIEKLSGSTTGAQGGRSGATSFRD